MLTEAVIRRLAPRAHADYIAALVNGDETFEHWQINTPARMTAFLGTVLAETGGLTIVQENLNYTTPARIAAVWPSRFTVASASAYVRKPEALAEAVYGGRMANERNGVGDGDGFRYRGRGLCQTTGRSGYEAMGRLVGLPLGDHPELLDDPVNSLKAACAECAKFNAYADRGEKGFMAYSNGINRGNPSSTKPPIGWADRLAYYRRVAALLQVEDVADDTSEMGDRGALIEGYQKRLAELGYFVGTIDGIYGSLTRSSVLAFQAEAGLETDGRIGPLTRAALNKPDAPHLPVGDRAAATGDDLAKAGSGTVIDARAQKAAAAVVVGGSVAKAVQDGSDILTTMQGWVGDLGAMRGVIDPAVDATKWLLGHWYIAAAIAGIIIIRKSNAIEAARVWAHRAGAHLGR